MLYISDTANRIIKSEQERLGRFIGYPSCWDVTVYPTLDDALKEIGCNPSDCANRNCK